MKNTSVICSLLLVINSASLMADTRDDEIQMLREQLRILTERLDRLEQSTGMQPSQPAQLAEKAPTKPAQKSTADANLQAQIDRTVDEKMDARLADVAWAETMRWSGDFRYRYENIGEENTDDRNRSRIRARAHLEADISDSVVVGIGLASGGDDPVSTNQTLGGGESTKPLNLDLAYFQWTGLKDTTIVGGKFKNALYRPGKNGLLWDSDWRPEGTEITYEKENFFITAIGTWVESDSRTAQQEFSYGVQTGLTLPAGDALQFSAGLGFFKFDTAGKRSFFGDGDFFGNSFNPVTRRYLNDYHVVEGYAELTTQLLGQPLLVFGDYVINTKVSDHDTGYAFGATYGKTKNQGTWSVSYVWQLLEADAVFGLLTDSDFGGGGTDAEGSIFSGSYAFHDNWNFQFTYYLNDVDISTDDPRDFDRLQLDLNFKFK